MARKKQQDSESLALLKKKIQDGQIIVGRDRVMKQLKAKTLSKVLVAANCPDSFKEELQHYASLAGIEVTVLEQDNEELGILCKKNFLVSVLGITGE